MPSSRQIGACHGFVLSYAASSKQLLYSDSTRRERFEQNLYASLRARGSAHEHVKRRVLQLGPGVDGDVALGEYGDATDSAVGFERMQVNVQQRSASNLHALA